MLSVHKKQTMPGEKHRASLPAESFGEGPAYFRLRAFCELQT